MPDVWLSRVVREKGVSAAVIWSQARKSLPPLLVKSESSQKVRFIRDVGNVSRLSDFLRLLNATDAEPSSIHAVIRHEKSLPPEGGRPQPPVIGKRKSKSDGRGVPEICYEVWATLPEIVRVDTTRFLSGQSWSNVESDVTALNSIGPVNTNWWKLGQSRIPESNRDLVPLEYRRHFEPLFISAMFKQLHLETIDECVRVGHQCITIRGVPIENSQTPIDWLPGEATEFEFDADVFRPCLLAIRGIREGEIVESYEVTSLEYDEPIADDTFEKKTRSESKSDFAEVKFLSFEDAAIFWGRPILLPSEWSHHIHSLQFVFHLKTSEADNSLLVFDPHNAIPPIWLTLRNTPDLAKDEDFEWEQIDLDGRKIHFSDAEVEGSLRIATFEENGTHIQIGAALRRQEMLEFVKSIRTCPADDR